jgi:AcrR family transcriptional regulator
VPAPNDERRAALADAAIALLAESGVHGVTHRTAERRAGLPTGTASNYFRTRESLLVAVADRIAALHHADMERAAREHPTATPATTVGQTIDLIAGSLFLAATTHRDRYLAIFELRMESLRRPRLAAALAVLEQASIGFTADHHSSLGLDIPRDAVPTLITLYGGALFTLVSQPPGTITRQTTHAIATAVVHGALSPGTFGE